MKLIKSLLLIFGLAIIMVGCQEEIVEITGDQEGQNLNTNTVNLLLKVSKNDGSRDNIVDGASCFEIKLPFNVIVNGSELLIEDEEDYETIEALYEEFVDDLDELVIIYPITLILDDYSEEVVNDAQELERLVSQCLNNGNDDIECIDFQYPITFSVFDENNDISTVTVNNDRELNELILRVLNDGVASVNFPVTVTYPDGSTEEIRNAQELEAAIEEAIGDCDEDDDNDPDDDDNNDIAEQELEEFLIGCGEWRIDKFRIGNDSDNDRFEEYAFTFKENGQLRASIGDDLTEGQWEVGMDDNGLRVVIQMEGALSDINDNWRLHNIDGENGNGKAKVDLRLGQNRLRFESACDGDGSDDNSDEDEDNVPGEADVREIMTACKLIIDKLERGDQDLDDAFDPFTFTFNSDGTVTATNGDNTFAGSWNTINTDAGLGLEISIADLPEVNDNWRVHEVEQDDDDGFKIDLRIGNDRLRFEQDCDNDGD